MKRNVLKLILVVLGVLPTLSAFAYDVEIDGIYYNLVTKLKTAEVTNGGGKYQGEVVIPDSIESGGVIYSVTSIHMNAFNECYVTSVTIPNSVTSIGENAFYRCSSLTSVTIGNGVTSIGKQAFYNCYRLTSVTIPNSVTSIGPSAFRGCSSLTSVHITDIAAWCAISFGSVDNNPLYYAKDLYLNGEKVTDLVIPSSVTHIGASAFAFCSSLTSVTIPNSVASISDYAFYDCSGLTSVTISNSVTSIGNHAFYNCSCLTSVTIPNSVTSIDDRAFDSCSGLTSVTIPNSVTSIGNDAFKDCSGLTSVTIPNSVTSIGYDAFKDCSGLTSVTIGRGVRRIGEYAFVKCPNIEDVYCHAVNVPYDEKTYQQTRNYPNMFQDSYIEYATLHVPDESIDAYKAIAPWSGFGTIKGLSGAELEVKKCATPTIAYENGRLKFSCETEGAEFVTEITDADIKKHYDNEVQLGVTYNVSVYATLSGYDNSDKATATLCWIDSEPKTEGVTTAVTSVKARAVLIRNNGGTLTITSEDNTESTPVQVYNTAGQQVGAANMTNGTATVNTNIQRGEVAIVKIGEKSVKVFMK